MVVETGSFSFGSEVPFFFLLCLNGFHECSPISCSEIDRPDMEDGKLKRAAPKAQMYAI